MPFNDRTISHINNLRSDVAALGFRFINDLRQNGVPAYISSSSRTPAEQRRLFSQGRTKTLNSKHLSGRAFDIDILGWGRDDLPREFWDIIGKYGESLGLKWGGRFNGFYDAGHFEL